MKVLLSLLSLLLANFGVATEAENDGRVATESVHGPSSRFWQHIVDQEILMATSDVEDGVEVNHYHNIRQCLIGNLTDTEWAEVSDTNSTENLTNPEAGISFEDPFRRNITCLLEVKNAIRPVQVKAVQSLAACVRHYIPTLYEARAMYQEFNLDKDPPNRSLGGNCPTHLAPLVGIFLPQVVEQIYRTLEFAFSSAGWAVDVPPEGYAKLPPPREMGMRASEHLTYSKFPLLREHDDGEATAYTINFAFTDERDYDGGSFFIKTGRKQNFIKPKKYDALVFLGGRYIHGVSDITGGHREMFSTEMWHYPDIPFGSNLWNSVPQNMRAYIDECNREREAGNAGPCKANFASSTWTGMKVDEHKGQYSEKQSDGDEESVPAPSEESVVPVSVSFHSENSDLEVYWVDFNGEEKHIGRVTGGEVMIPDESFPATAFRMYDAVDENRYFDYAVDKRFGAHKVIKVNF